MRVLLTILSSIIIVLTIAADDFAEMPLPLLETFHSDDNTALDVIAFSPDGTLLATGGRDNRVTLRDSETGEIVQTFFGHDDWVKSLAFNHDGTLLASGDRSGIVYVWDLEINDAKYVLRHDSEVRGLAFKADGILLASGDVNGVVLLYDLATGLLAETVTSYGGAVWMLAFTPDDSALATAGEDGTVWIQGFWDEDGWLKKISGHEGAVTSLAFDTDSEKMLTGGLDGTLRLWDLTTDDVEITESEMILQGHRTAVMNVAYVYNDTLIVSVSLDGSTRLWDAESGDEITLLDSENITPLLNMTINADSSQLVSSATDGTMKLWNIEDTEITLMLERLTPPEVVVVNTPVPLVVIPANPTPVPVNPIRPTGVAIVPTPIAPVATIAPPPTAIPVQPPIAPPALEGRSIAIPSVGIQSYVGTFYLDGVSWAIDPWVNYVGHLQGTSDLNMPGNVVVGAHSEYPDGSPGVFRALYAVGIGDEIFVSDGTTQKRYVVVNILNVNYKDLSVVYPTAHNRITLITCDIPSYVVEQNLYHERLVVIADEL